MSEDVKTKFKGPGEWRSQVARLEGENPEPKKSRVKELFESVKDEHV